MTLTRLSTFGGEAVLSLPDAKNHLRVRHDDEDDLITSLRDAAVQYVERVSGVILSPAEFRWEGSCFARAYRLPVRPVTEIVSVIYHDDALEEVTYEGATVVRGELVPVAGETWPTTTYVAIEFMAGADVASPDLVAAAKLMLGHLYENRSAVTTGPTPVEAPLAVQSLIQTHRQMLV